MRGWLDKHVARPLEVRMQKLTVFQLASPGRGQVKFWHWRQTALYVLDLASTYAPPTRAEGRHAV